jgi:hexosaminidase
MTFTLKRCIVFIFLLIPFPLFTFSQSTYKTLPLIPKPAKMVPGKGSFTFDQTTSFVVANGSAKIADLASLTCEQLYYQTGINPPLKHSLHPKSEKNAVVLIKNPSMKAGAEGYRMTVSALRILIESPTDAGLFYGTRTLMQMLTPPLKDGKVAIPAVTIDDFPRFVWRGMHLDVCRHFFPVEFVKKYIDFIAMYKMNTFHWHLTDDQGWRIEIKKYPKLTEVGAWRSGSMVGPFSMQQYDTIRYGGYYTQEQIKDVVRYAAKRHVTVVPEIEMPGHSLAALASYPELSCTGGPFEVGKAWGVFEDVFCPKETTFTFLENVLTEVMALFPGKYIHVGGDECPKVRWKKCEHCQSLIKQLKLKDEHELQSYFIRRIEKLLNANGRKLIGWDEILEGGLAPNATVMSWRGIDGGIAAAKSKHFAVMSPGSHCYFDYYQGNPMYEPLAIGGYTTVEKVYSYEPVPDVLKPSQRKYILGAQGNVWAEYITTPEHVEYMAIPRMAALAEAVWSPKVKRSYDEFQQRLMKHFGMLDVMGVNYSKAIYDLKTNIKPSPERDGVLFELSSPFGSGGIRYTIDGSKPTASSLQYSEPIAVASSKKVQVGYFDGLKLKGNIIVQEFIISKSTGKKVNLKTPPHKNYEGDGAFTLVNGLRGHSLRHAENWIGWWGPDMEAVVDFGKQESFSKVSVDFFNGEGSWIHLPKSVEVFTSDDGVNFTSVQTMSGEDVKSADGVVVMNIGDRKARYLKVFARNAGKIPDGKQGAGNNAWLFADEIVVE